MGGTRKGGGRSHDGGCCRDRGEELVVVGGSLEVELLDTPPCGGAGRQPCRVVEVEASCSLVCGQYHQISHPNKRRVNVDGEHCYEALLKALKIMGNELSDGRVFGFWKAESKTQSEL